MPERQPPDGEVAESLARSFDSRWWVASDYRIERGYVLPLVGGQPIKRLDLHPALDEMTSYMPMAHPELPDELAKIDGRGRDGVLEFVRHYGLLGLWRFMLPPAPGQRPAARARAIAEPMRLENKDTGEVKAQLLIKGIDDVYGDPVAWILGHARSVRLVLELAGALDDKDELAERLEALKATDGSGWPIAFPLMRHEDRYPALWKTRPAATPRETALKVIAYQLNDALRNISRVLGPSRTGAPCLESRFSPEDLIACIYWLLADAVVGGTIRRCPSCGRFFTATHDRMKFCPRPFGQEGTSLCMNRAKQRRFRAPKRASRRRRQPLNAPRGGHR
jgi:hypothetical protein